MSNRNRTIRAFTPAAERLGDRALPSAVSVVGVVAAPPAELPGPTLTFGFDPNGSATFNPQGPLGPATPIPPLEPPIPAWPPAPTPGAPPLPGSAPTPAEPSGPLEGPPDGYAYAAAPIDPFAS